MLTLGRQSLRVIQAMITMTTRQAKMAAEMRRMCAFDNCALCLPSSTASKSGPGTGGGSVLSAEDENQVHPRSTPESNNRLTTGIEVLHSCPTSYFLPYPFTSLGSSLDETF